MARLQWLFTTVTLLFAVGLQASGLVNRTITEITWGLAVLLIVFMVVASRITRPQIVLDNKMELASVSNDPRPQMKDWWHLRVENRALGMPFITREEATGCRANLEFLGKRGQVKRASGCFLALAPNPPQEETTLIVGQPRYIPVYLRAQGIRHPSGQSLRDGVYVTGVEFLYHPQLVGAQMLPPGTYTARITVTCEGRRFVREIHNISVTSPDGFEQELDRGGSHNREV